MSGDQQDNEYLERLGLDARRIDDRLIEEIIYQLCEAEDGDEDEGESQEAYIQSDRHCAAVFQYKPGKPYNAPDFS